MENLNHHETGRDSATESAAKRRRHEGGPSEFLPEALDRRLGIEGVPRRSKPDLDRTPATGSRT